MSVRLTLAVVAAVSVAAAIPALAQEAAAPTPTPAPAQEAPDTSAAEAALEAKGEAFEASMDAMGAEMEAAVTASGGDRARLTMGLDAIVAKYQPDADAFAAELETFLAAHIPSMPEEQRAQMTQMGPMLSAQIKGAPAQARAGILQGSAAGTTAPTPATPQ